MNKTVHAFADDALGDLDATALADLVRRGERSSREVVAAAIARAERVQPFLHALAHDNFEGALQQAMAAPGDGVFAGVPTVIKDNTRVRGLPTRHGSLAVPPRPAPRTGNFARQFLSPGLVCVGKSQLPEFGFNASTEFMERPPVRNPWHTDYSAGASSGGSAALVAAGVVPLAHANDGGGSIRIPASACGLVGLKPTRGRHLNTEGVGLLPINIVSEGVLTRSVRDTANFWAALERYWRNPRLKPIGDVQGPGQRRLRIGFVQDSVNGESDGPTRATLLATARLLESLGHRVYEVPLPFGKRFVNDFIQYWGMLAMLLTRFGRLALHPRFDARQLESLSRGLGRFYLRHAHETPLVLLRLRQSIADYARHFGKDYDVLLTPVLTHTTPPLGYFSPLHDFDLLLERLTRYIGYTPLNNVTGSPALSLPMGATLGGLPVAVQLCAACGDERTLLELAFELEAVQPFRRIQELTAEPAALPEEAEAEGE